MKKLGFVLTLLLAFSCAQESSSPMSTMSRTEAMPSVVEMQAPLEMARIAGGIKDDSDLTTVPSGPLVPATDARPRKRIVSGSMEIRHETPAALESVIQTRAVSLGGYVASSGTGEDWLNMEVKIPADFLDDFLSSVSAMGTVISKQFSTTDITQAYFDLATRIANQDVLVRRIRAYLGEARTVDDLLNIENRLSQATTELEQMQGQRLNWDRDVAFSSVSLIVRTPIYQSGGIWPSLQEGFEDFLRNIVWALYGILFFILYLVAILGPIGLFVWLIYVLTYGKIGIIRRIWPKKKD